MLGRYDFRDALISEDQEAASEFLYLFPAARYALSQVDAQVSLDPDQELIGTADAKKMLTDFIPVVVIRSEGVGFVVLAHPAFDTYWHYTLMQIESSWLRE